MESSTARFSWAKASYGLALAWSRVAQSLSGRPSRVREEDGILYLGNATKTGDEVWMSANDARTHFLALGTTGSAKTQGLLGLLSNALSWGSGCTIIDGKGDVSLFTSVYNICRHFGREDDLLCINFMSCGGVDGNGRRLSHRMSPFATAGGDALAMLLQRMLGSEFAQQWSGRGAALVDSMSRALVYLRDHEDLRLTPKTLCDHLRLENVIALADDDRLPENLQSSVRSYLEALPGFRWERGSAQSPMTVDQHRLIEMNILKKMHHLSNIYEHIFEEEGIDVDMIDIVSRRRILVVLLPAMDHGDDATRSLGLVFFSSITSMFTEHLSRSPGGWSPDVRPSFRASTPYMIIMDEAGRYLVKDSAIFVSMARSLNISLVYAAQDVSSLRRHDFHEGCDVMNNTLTKLIMRSEEMPEFTAAFHDLKSMKPGEAEFIQRDLMTRVQLFYADGSGLGHRQARLSQTISLVWDKTEGARAGG